MKYDKGASKRYYCLGNEMLFGVKRMNTAEFDIVIYDLQSATRI